MSKISFAIQGKKIFTFDEILERRYHTFLLFVLSWGVKALFVLLALTTLLSYFNILVISLTVWEVLVVLMVLLGLVRIVVGYKYGVEKLKLSEILLLVSLLALGISRFLSKDDNSMHLSILLIVLSVLFLLRNYSDKVMKVVLGIGYALVTLKVLLDMFYVIQALIEAFRNGTKQITNINGLNFEVYMVAIGLYYLLLKMKMKVYYKVTAYVLLISSLFLFSYSMQSMANYWVVSLTAILLVVIELVLNYKKVISFFKVTLNSFKEKKYVSFGINLVIVLVVLGLAGIGVYLLFSKLSIIYVTSEFTYFWQTITTGNILQNIFTGTTTATTTGALMSQVGIQIGVASLLSLLALVVLMLYKVIKFLPKHSELYLYFVIFVLIHSILMPVSLLPLISLAFVYLALNGDKLERVKELVHDKSQNGKNGSKKKR